jgi:RNA polymerase sigma factor (sigma-70 family)
MADEDRHDELLRRYLEELEAQPLLSADDELILGRRARRGDGEASSQLVKGNLRLVVAVAKRYRATGVPLLDLIQDGNLGLVQAVEKYDPDRGFSFRTYAMWWIRQAISRGLADAGKGLVVHDLETRLQAAWDEVVRMQGRQPTLAELAAAVDDTEERVIEALGLPPQPPAGPADH